MKAEEERRKLISKTVNESRFKRSKSLPRNAKIQSKKNEVEAQTLVMKSASTSCTEINKLTNRSTSNLQLVPSKGSICNNVNCGGIYDLNCPFNQSRGRTITRTTCCFDKSCNQSLYITSKCSKGPVSNRPAITNGTLQSSSRALCPVQDRFHSSQRSIKSNTIGPITYDYNYVGYGAQNDSAQTDYNHENLYSIPSKRQLVPRDSSPCSIYCQPLDPNCKECTNSIHPIYASRTSQITELPQLATCSRPIAACSACTSLPLRPSIVQTCQSCILCPPPTVTHHHCETHHGHKYTGYSDYQNPYAVREQLNGHRSTVGGTIKDAAMIHDHHHLPVTTRVTTSTLPSQYQHQEHYIHPREPTYSSYRSTSSNFSSPSHLRRPNSPRITSSLLPSRPLSPIYSRSPSRIPLPLPPPPSPPSSSERTSMVSFSPSAFASSPSRSSSFSHSGHRCHDCNHANQVLSPFYRQGSIKLPPSSSSSYYRTHDTCPRTFDMTNCRRSLADGGKNRPSTAILQDTPWTPASCKQCNLNKSIINNKINLTTNANLTVATKNNGNQQNGHKIAGSLLPRHPSLTSSSQQPLPLPAPSSSSPSSPSSPYSKAAVSFQSKTTSNEYSRGETAEREENHGEIEREQEVKK